PSRAKATLGILLACESDQSRAPSSTSHNLTVLSQLPVTSWRPSGLKVRARILSVWACQTRDKVWPPSSQSRTSPRLPAAAQYCPLGLMRSEEHTSELQSPYDLVCRLL